jgi:hypothetical protein
MLLLLLACGLGGCAGSASAQSLPRSLAVATSQPSQEQPPPASGVLKHAKTWETAYDSPQQYDATFGFTSWSYVAPYIDLVMAPVSVVDTNVHAGGVQTMTYADPNFCSGSYADGPNQFASPDCAAFPADAFYADGHGNVLTVSYNGTIQQRVGNPASPSLQTLTSAFVKAVTQQYPFAAALVDDATVPTSAYPGAMCWGLGTLGHGPYSCGGAPGGPALSPFDATHTLADWQNGEQAIGASLSVPAIFNGLQGGNLTGTGEPAPIVAVVLRTPGAWGAMCDGCFYTASNAFTVTGPVLDSRLAGVMQLVAAGKNVIVLNDNVTDPAARERGLAITMLAYDAGHVWEGGGPCGNVSHIHACPEAALTFYNAYGAYPAKPSSLAAGTGVYAREFASCYRNGIAAGPCAAVVNVDPYGAHALPSLRNTYAHTVQIAGTSLCNCFGDSGSVGLTGPAAPKALPPASGYVLFP